MLDSADPRVNVLAKLGGLEFLETWDRRTVPPGIEVHPRVLELLARPYHEQGSDGWHEERREALTASDVAAVLGQNPYNSAEALWRKKIGMTPHDEGNEATRHGHDYEWEALVEYMCRRGCIVFKFGCLRHEHQKLQWVRGSPDGITHDGILVEVKCPLRRKVEPIIHKEYVPQVQTLMEVCQLDACHFIVYRPAPGPNKEPEFAMVEAPRRPLWFQENLICMTTWWARVQRTKLGIACSQATGAVIICRFLKTKLLKLPWREAYDTRLIAVEWWVAALWTRRDVPFHATLAKERATAKRKRDTYVGRVLATLAVPQPMVICADEVPDESEFEPCALSAPAPRKDVLVLTMPDECELAN